MYLSTLSRSDNIFPPLEIRHEPMAAYSNVLEKIEFFQINL